MFVIHLISQVLYTGIFEIDWAIHLPDCAVPFILLLYCFGVFAFLRFSCLAAIVAFAARLVDFVFKGKALSMIFCPTQSFRVGLVLTIVLFDFKDKDYACKFGESHNTKKRI